MARPDPARSRRIMDRLKLRHLRLIDAIVEARSLSAAAAMLNITQPAASKGLREIEDLLGLPLFVRSARGLTLTMFGRSLVAHGKTIQSEVRHITEELEAVADGNAGEVRVGAMLVSLPWLLPAALRLMRERAGQAPVRIIEGVQDVLVQELRSGAVDMIVGRLAPIDPRERLTQEGLLHEPMGVGAGARHPLTRRAVSYADLAACRWILPPADSVVHSSVLQLFAQHGLANPEPFVETTSYLTSRTLMIEQDAIAALPLAVVRRDIERGDLAMLPVRFPHEPLAVGVVTVAERRPSPAAAPPVFCLRGGGEGAGPALGAALGALRPARRRR